MSAIGYLLDAAERMPSLGLVNVLLVNMIIGQEDRYAPRS
jgi:hypothetical protein